MTVRQLMAVILLRNPATTVPIVAYWSASFDIVGRPARNKLSAEAFKVSPGFLSNRRRPSVSSCDLAVRGGRLR